MTSFLDAIRQSTFYSQKVTDRHFVDFSALPFTTKAELVADQSQHPPYGTNHTRPLIEYTRLHQTSGTASGRPLVWLDTPASWQSVVDCWLKIFALTGTQSSDRLFLAFSFGPFLGFWSAFEAGQQLGAMTLTGGGMSSRARLQQIVEHHVTVLLCTPTYALHLAEVAAQDKFDLVSASVRALIVAGEPGGLIPSTRQRIESAWGARVFDHYGLTEVGPVAVEPDNVPGGMQILDNYLAEVINPKTTEPTPDGEVGELVLTNLTRLDCPIARYRTGDLVQAKQTERGLWLERGILGRVDDMIQVRGNNIYPAAIESLVRGFPEVAEFQIEIDGSSSLNELRVTVEPFPGKDGQKLAAQIAEAVQNQWLFRPVVVSVSPGTLPRFEMKARRIHRKS